MKFRILEQRGKYRIERKLKSEWLWRPLVYLINPDRAYFERDTDYMTYMEFNSYKEAKKYIKKHYGLEGVKAIQKPDWKQV